MNRPYKGPDRRAAGRPAPGDLRACPKCGGTLRFEERFAISQRGVTERKPAWVCRNPNCLYDWLVRATDRL